MNEQQPVYVERPQTPFLAVFTGFLGAFLLLVSVVGIIKYWSAVVDASGLVVMILLGSIVIAIPACVIIAGIQFYVRIQLHNRHLRIDSELKQEELAAREDERRRANETHQVHMHLLQTRLLADERGNRPHVFYPATGEVIEVRSGNYIQPVSEHYHYEVNSGNAGGLGLPAPDMAVLLPSAAPFAEMIGRITPGQFCLGYGQNGMIAGSIDDLLSTAIIGRPGTGKTTLLRFVCAQLLHAGGAPVVLDPHGNIADEVGSALNCYVEPGEIDSASLQLERQLDYRLKERREGRKPAKIILLLADEWPVIAASTSHAVSTIKRIVLEGRKVGMYALISGQGIPAALLDGTLVRDALSSRYVFNTTPQQARLAGLDNETAKTLLARLDTAGPGRAILASSRLKPELVAIPDTSVRDIQACMVDGSITPVTDRLETPVSSDKQALEAYSGDTGDTRNVSSGMPPSSGAGVSSIGNETRATIRRMRAAGKPHREIAPLVGLAGNKYALYQNVCQEEGIQ